jgi:hypothetical protein
MLTEQPKWEATSPIRAVRNPIHKMDVAKHKYPCAISIHASPLPRKEKRILLFVTCCHKDGNKNINVAKMEPVSCLKMLNLPISDLYRK